MGVQQETKKRKKDLQPVFSWNLTCGSTLSSFDQRNGKCSFLDLRLDGNRWECVEHPDKTCKHFRWTMISILDSQSLKTLRNSNAISGC